MQPSTDAICALAVESSHVDVQGLTRHEIMKKINVVKSTIRLVIAVALTSALAVSCHKDDPVVPDQPADTTEVPEEPANHGYMLMNGDTLDIFAICKMEGSSTNLDISFTDRPEMLLTITDGSYSSTTQQHAVQFCINPDRSTTAQFDSYEGVLQTTEEDGRSEIVFSGSTAQGKVELYYSGTLDDANMPMGQGVITLAGQTGECSLARVFSLDRTFSYIIYENGYFNTIKFTSLSPITAGEYQVSPSLSSSAQVQVQVLYFGGAYAGYKPTSGTLTVTRQGAQFDFDLRSTSAQGEIGFTYHGSFNRQCVVDF